MSSEQGALPLIRESLEAFERIGDRATAREQAHAAAAKAWLDGDFERASQLYGAITIEHPRDLVALQAGHVIDFYLGDSIMLRDRIAQALPYWNHEVPGYGYLLGMHAFGLEETGNYGRAEDVGRHALALNARDPWAVHAVQHVFEMQGRIHDGIEWLNATSPNWADSALAFHNWWHLALHQLELGDIPAALDVYDRLVHPKATAVALELIDASQLLARIALRGGTVGSRWQALADCWSQTTEGGFYVFNDLHALLAYAFAGREQDTRRMLSALERARTAPGPTRRTCAPWAFPSRSPSWRWRRAGPAEAVERLLPIRSRSYRIGGSHAQRDLVQLTVAGAALASGNGRLARALAASAPNRSRRARTTGGLRRARSRRRAPPSRRARRASTRSCGGARNCGATLPRMYLEIQKQFDNQKGDDHVDEPAVPRTADVAAADGFGFRAVLRHPRLRVMACQWPMPGRDFPALLPRARIAARHRLSPDCDLAHASADSRKSRTPTG